MKLTEKIQAYNSLREDIAKAIDYGEPRYLGEIIDERESIWSIDNENVRIHDKEDEQDYYEYIISSYGAKGEEFFIGEIDNLVFIMCRPEEEFAENADVMIFSKENKIKFNYEW